MDYVATYRKTQETDEPTWNSIQALNAMDGLCTLDEVRENCIALTCEADLYDEPGFRRGWVHADGSYRLP